MRLLIAEDELDLAEALTVFFEKNQFSVDTVHDGFAAYDYASTGEYDAIVLDVMMPKMDGVQVLQRLREEGIRNQVSLIAGGSIRSSADVVKAVALGADACYIGTAALIAMGCHLCRTCQSGRCAWGIATQRPELVKRLDPDEGTERLINLMTAWKHEIMEIMGGMGINSIEALRGNRLMLRAVGLTEKELSILGVSHAGE